MTCSVCLCFNNIRVIFQKDLSAECKKVATYIKYLLCDDFFQSMIVPQEISLVRCSHLLSSVNVVPIMRQWSVVMRLWDMWGVLWTVEALAQLVGVVATPLDPAPLTLRGERRTLLPTRSFATNTACATATLQYFSYYYKYIIIINPFCSYNPRM